jgi:hypothetical protein
MEASSAEAETYARSAGEQDETDTRMITYSVSLNLAVENIEETKRTLTEQVGSFDGYITRESSTHITARIPAQNMDSFLAIARENGKIENETRTGIDITEQYRDNVIRLESLRNIRERYLLLLQRASTVSEMISIERELERINTQIELMEGKIRFAEMSVAYSDITVRLSERVRPGPLSWIFYGLYLGIKWLFVW